MPLIKLTCKSGGNGTFARREAREVIPLSQPHNYTRTKAAEKAKQREELLSPRKAGEWGMLPLPSRAIASPR